MPSEGAKLYDAEGMSRKEKLVDMVDMEAKVVKETETWSQRCEINMV